MIYDEFQKQAMSYIDQEYSVLVSAPTGAGKTVIAEHAIRQCLERGEKVIYTAPIKALSNQKFRDFQEQDEKSVGILTGDVSLNEGAPIQIMTTEIFRNKLLEGDQNLREYRWVIFDEIHYLDDYERGTVWEESLIFMPDHMNFLGLSATIPNLRELVDWLEDIHGKTIKTVVEKTRPVPLHVFYQCQGKVYDDLRQLEKSAYRQARGGRGGRVPSFIPLKPNSLLRLVHMLEDRDLLPAIYFVFSRKRSQLLAEELHGFDFLNSDEKKKITEMFDALCARFDIQHEPSVSDIRPLVTRGIAYHHAGMLPTLKETIERLFTARLLKVIFTTETFALGINMPARSVIFDELRKFYGNKFDTLRTRDFYQMAGRAGRRSIDTEGYVYCRVNPHYISTNELRRAVQGSPEKVRSQFSASYATILNLYRRYRERLYDIYPKSFHYFQTGKSRQKRAIGYMRARVDILKELGYISGEALTPQGDFAAQVYGYELVFGQLYAEGFLQALSPLDLGILAVSAVFEPRKGQTRPKLAPHVRRLQKVSDASLKPVHKLERITGVRPLTKKCFFHLAPMVEAWMKGADFHAVCGLTDTDEGTIIRHLRMGIQVLRQISSGIDQPELRHTIGDAMSRLNRDIVDSEKQLRS
ncbi:MAG: DEAD/DEAH box helicase [Candidatus Omnitrophota bacterium]